MLRHVAALALFTGAGVLTMQTWLHPRLLPSADFPGFAAEVAWTQATLDRDGSLPVWTADRFAGTTRFMSNAKELTTYPLTRRYGAVQGTKSMFLLMRIIAALGLYLSVDRPGARRRRDDRTVATLRQRRAALDAPVEPAVGSSTAMLKLHGFIGSSYYSIVKLVLLEKGLPFEEVPVALGAFGKLEADERYRAKSPIGKVPSLETEHGFLSETNVIIDYLDDLGHGPSFYPADPYGKAKVRELIKYLELYVELPARRLYGEFFDRPVPKEEKVAVRALLQQGFDALQRLARFDPYLVGPEITYADFYAQFALTSATWTTRQLYGWDTYNTLPGVRRLVTLVGARETTKRLMAERRAASAAS